MKKKWKGKPPSINISIYALILMILLVLTMIGGVLYWWGTRNLSGDEIWYVLFPLIVLLLALTSKLISLIIYDYRIRLYMTLRLLKGLSNKELSEAHQLFEEPKSSPLPKVIESIIALLEKWIDGKNKGNSP